jgi:CheY-like chemotaxis protein
LAQLPSATPPSEDPGVRLDGLKVLVVDDAPDNVMLVSRMLRLAGAVVDGAANGREAVERALGGSYDAVLMDLQMPVMDGFEATAELRAAGCTFPIIALTAHVLQDEERRCLHSGFSGHLRKPLNRLALLTSLATHAPLHS